MIFRVCKWRFSRKFGSLTPNRYSRKKRTTFRNLNAPDYVGSIYLLHKVYATYRSV